LGRKWTGFLKEKGEEGYLGWGRRISQEEKLGRRELSRVSNLPLRLTESWASVVGELERETERKKPKELSDCSREFAGRNACTFGDVYVLWIRYTSSFFSELHQCGSTGQEMCVVSLLCCCVWQSLNHWGSERSGRHGRALKMSRRQ
jgi:hypothetical protein